MDLNFKIEETLNSLEKYFDKEDFKGWDPFDGLNSPYLNLIKSRFLCALLLQIIKKSPLNLRSFLRIAKSYNPKGLSLLLESFILKYKIFQNEESFAKAERLANWLINNYSKGYSGMCWGYPFDWANRKFYAPKWTPNIITTTFCANSLLEFFYLSKKKVYLDAAKSSCDFIINDLNTTITKGSICFSYTPIDRTCIHNANMLGSSLLAKVGNLVNSDKYIKFAIQSMRYSIRSQKSDGSWSYGEDKNQSWIDGFHSGYSLIALSSFLENTNSVEFKRNLEKGFKFYRKNFFLSDGIVKYYHNKVRPLDSHSFAHAIFCLCKLSYLEDNRVLINRIINKLYKYFWNEKSFFYYQKNRFFSIKIPYMRWVQAWAYLALYTYLFHYKKP